MADLEATMRKELPPLPRAMRHLALDRRGYPVPAFVAWLDENENELPYGVGRPEFRMMAERRLVECLRHDECWICGGKMESRKRAFVIGPMCMVNRINSEPPSHIECADYAARACPFLARPHMVRRENDLPEKLKEPAGKQIERNPGVACVWIVKSGYPIKRVPNGILFDLPRPVEVRFYAEGRPATRGEVEHSIETGLPALLDVCVSSVERLEVRSRAALTQHYWPAA